MKIFPCPEKLKFPVCTLALAAVCLLSACRQIGESFEETRHPKPEAPAPDTRRQSVQSASAYSTSTSVTHASDTGSMPQRKFFETSAAGWDSIQQQLYALPGFSGKKLYVYQGFYVYDFQGGMIGISLQDPDKKMNVDAYRYFKGSWERQGPVKITGNIPLERWLMPLDEVKFSALKKIWDIAQRKSADIEEAQRITHIFFNYMRQPRVKEWYLSIRSPRKDYYLEFDPEGNLKKVR